MKKTYAIKTSGLTTIARDTVDGWKETLEVLKTEGIEVELKSFSDYSGKAIESDQILFYHFHGDCPVSCPSWKF